MNIQALADLRAVCTYLPPSARQRAVCSRESTLGIQVYHLALTQHISGKNGLKTDSTKLTDSSLCRFDFAPLAPYLVRTPFVVRNHCLLFHRVSVGFVEATLYNLLACLPVCMVKCMPDVVPANNMPLQEAAMNPSNLFKVIGLILSLFPLSGLALTVDDLDRFVDNDLTTLDTVTGLEWLDVNLTVGVSYFTVEEQFLPGGDLEGYRHATENEIQDVFSAFDFPLYGSMIADNANVRLFIDLFGGISESWRDAVHGWADGQGRYENIPGRDYSMVPLYGLSARTDGDVYIVAGETMNNPSLAYPGIGSFVVRHSPNHQIVPEIDAASAPMALSLLLLVVLARREQRRRQ